MLNVGIMGKNSLLLISVSLFGICFAECFSQFEFSLSTRPSSLVYLLIILVVSNNINTNLVASNCPNPDFKSGNGRITFLTISHCGVGNQVLIGNFLLSSILSSMSQLVEILHLWLWDCSSLGSGWRGI
jgi:hypothetical protein